MTLLNTLKKYWPWFAAGAVAVSLVAAAFAAYYANAPTVSVEVVKRGTIRAYIDERGKTRLPRIHEITMPETGRLLPIVLKVGDRVAKRTTVAQMVPADLELDAREAEAVVNRLTASLAEQRDESLEQHALEQARQLVAAMAKVVMSADARREASQQALTLITGILERAKKMVATQAGAEEELERTQMEYVNNSVQYKQDELMAEALRLLDTALNLLPAMVNDYMTRRRLTATTLERQREEAQVQLERARLNMQRGTMSSPIDGVVLERAIDNERYLTAGTLLLKLGDPEQLEVVVDILTEDATRVQKGDQVEIYGDAVQRQPGQGLNGKVDRVEPQGFTKVSSLGVEQQRVWVVVNLDPDARQTCWKLGLGVGYRVRVRIFTEAREEALIIPRTALFRGVDGEWQVYAVRDGKLERATVQVGILNDDQAEVLEGLEENARVVLAPDNNLSPGQRVHVGR